MLLEAATPTTHCARKVAHNAAMSGPLHHFPRANKILIHGIPIYNLAQRSEVIAEVQAAFETYGVRLITFISDSCVMLALNNDSDVEHAVLASGELHLSNLLVSVSPARRVDPPLGPDTVLLDQPTYAHREEMPVKDNHTAVNAADLDPKPKSEGILSPQVGQPIASNPASGDDKPTATTPVSVDEVIEKATAESVSFTEHYVTPDPTAETSVPVDEEVAKETGPNVEPTGHDMTELHPATDPVPVDEDNKNATGSNLDHFEHPPTTTAVPLDEDAGKTTRSGRELTEDGITEDPSIFTYLDGTSVILRRLAGGKRKASEDDIEIGLNGLKKTKIWCGIVKSVSSGITPLPPRKSPPSTETGIDPRPASLKIGAKATRVDSADKSENSNEKPDAPKAESAVDPRDGEDSDGLLRPPVDLPSFISLEGCLSDLEAEAQAPDTTIPAAAASVRPATDSESQTIEEKVTSIADDANQHDILSSTMADLTLQQADSLADGHAIPSAEEIESETADEPPRIDGLTTTISKLGLIGAEKPAKDDSSELLSVKEQVVSSEHSAQDAALASTIHDVLRTAYPADISTELRDVEHADLESDVLAPVHEVEIDHAQSDALVLTEKKVTTLVVAAPSPPIECPDSPYKRTMYAFPIDEIFRRPNSRIAYPSKEDELPIIANQATLTDDESSLTDNFWSRLVFHPRPSGEYEYAMAQYYHQERVRQDEIYLQRLREENMAKWRAVREGLPDALPNAVEYMPRLPRTPPRPVPWVDETTKNSRMVHACGCALCARVGKWHARPIPSHLG
ncbi:hypothetical protein CC80DRAFT_499053 [Byssothecium circinans]|uniref:Uncharacterized protein n=1 Tax=Byssothecium circinans TaxID=147558 RepID=A0A6A5UCQ4_9PLEO|nr:hypothetical protein CC80DRAFT_499053 [Byssothecium circinans]